MGLTGCRREFQARCQAHVRSVRGIQGGRGGDTGSVWSAAETDALYARALTEFGEMAERKEVLPSTGKTVASASAVKGVVKDLTKTYTLLGYAGHENPAKSEAVKSFRDGYERYLHDEGVKVQRAKVFTEAKLDALLAFLADRLKQEMDALELCTLLMDQAAVLYLWESLARGKECGALSAREIEGGAAPAAYPGWSKTVRQEPSARIPLAQAGMGVRLTFIEAAALR
ncbi:hypothetical protein KFL_006170030 [Klebsormidium nitens]|uniref:Uncharacterized protein n=1 Tax=Klebsormidium nitens TaxID=105231 RepID=A0A1Y1IH99_KLENI|nr:hypothetical protein KFL_006170030 [Klebsormidium nitens]|eukprot:GAQ90235.1 hypothetical protein KFL_006170030 [Klebsormidium nitens]